MKTTSFFDCVIALTMLGTLLLSALNPKSMVLLAFTGFNDDFFVA